MFNEFRKFIMRGNVIDLAVAVVIGAAFTAIVTSLVNNVLMPVISLVAGQIDFSNMYIPLKGQASNLTLEKAKEGGAVIAYGSFLTDVINFLIIAFVVFLIVRAINSMMARLQHNKKEEAAVPPAPTPDQALLAEIRDLLKQQNTKSGIS